MNSMSDLSKSTRGLKSPKMRATKLSISQEEKPKKRTKKHVEQPRRVDKVVFGSFNTNTPTMNVLISAYEGRFNSLYFGRAKASENMIAANERLEHLIKQYKVLAKDIQFELSKTLLCMKTDAKKQNINTWC